MTHLAGDHNDSPCSRSQRRILLEITMTYREGDQPLQMVAAQAVLWCSATACAAWCFGL